MAMAMKAWSKRNDNDENNNENNGENNNEISIINVNNNN